MKAFRVPLPFAVTALAVALLGAGCSSQDIPTSVALTPSTPSGADASAGSWKMIVLGSPTDF